MDNNKNTDAERQMPCKIDRFKISLQKFPFITYLLQIYYNDHIIAVNVTPVNDVSQSVQSGSL